MMGSKMSKTFILKFLNRKLSLYLGLVVAVMRPNPRGLSKSDKVSQVGRQVMGDKQVYLAGRDRCMMTACAENGSVRRDWHRVRSPERGSVDFAGGN
jgi:hypothetical protein